MKKLTLARLRNTTFKELYAKLVLGNELDGKEKQKLLSIAIIFINEDSPDIVKLGYRIVVFYSNLTGDYKPLYDVAINKGLFPIAKSIEYYENYKGQFEESFFKAFLSSFKENYKTNGIYISEQQKELISFFEENNDKTVSVIAPTSYGKSELIISSLRNIHRGNICIIVPTKALIVQTKRRLLNGEIQRIRKIITHPDMYVDGEQDITSVFTQERLLRLLQKNKHLNFDLVFVDEAHNLLENNNRSILLAATISILQKRNPRVVFKFLTPFLVDSSNLLVEHTNYVNKTYKITEYIKTERFYLYDFINENKMKLYDQFLNDFYYIESKIYNNSIDLIKSLQGEKNIIYLNKPKDIEHFSKRMSQSLNNIISERLNRACEELSNYLHADYFLIDCIRKGFIYHHGSVPDNIRIYIEHLYSTFAEIKYVITSSTLLEGVNLPAEKLFLLDNKKGTGNLSTSQFKNLVGRVCRFSEIFANGKLGRLEPEVYLMKTEYSASRSNIEKFIKDRMKVDKNEIDNPTNVLLKNVEINDENREQRTAANEFVENFEHGVISDFNDKYAQTEIGKLCFMNNITEIDILQHENMMQAIVDSNSNIKAISIKMILDLFSVVFLPFIKESESNISRLSNQEALNFYEMFLTWRIENASYSQMINSFIRYWSSLDDKIEDVYVYAGRWGDEIRGGFIPLWVNIKKKNKNDRINLAIVRIKEEQDFLDNTLIKFIEVFNELELLDEELYKKIKYGTTDEYNIILIKNGYSSSLARLIVKNYFEFLSVNIAAQKFSVDKSIILEMEKNNESRILIYELEYNLK